MAAITFDDLVKAQAAASPSMLDRAENIASEYIGRPMYNAARAGAQGVMEAINPNSATNQDILAKERTAGPFDISPELARVASFGKGALSALGLVPSTLGAPIAKSVGAAYDAVSPSFTPEQIQQINASGNQNLPRPYGGNDVLPTGEEAVNAALSALRPTDALVPSGTVRPLASKQLPSPQELKDAYLAMKNAALPIKVQPYQIGQMAQGATNALKGFAKPSTPAVRAVVDAMNQVASGRLPNGKIAPRPTVADLYDFRDQLSPLTQETQTTLSGLKATPQGAAATKVKGLLDSLMESVVPGWSEANANYSTAELADQLNKKAIKTQVRADAGNGDFAQRMRTVAGQLLNNDRISRTLTPNEITRLHSIAQGGTATQKTLNWLSDLLRSRGLRISIPIAAGVSGGGIPGAVAAAAAEDLGVRGLMALRNRLAGKQASKLVESVIRRSPLAKSMQASNFVQPAMLPYPGLLTAALSARTPLLLGSGAVPAYANQRQ